MQQGQSYIVYTFLDQLTYLDSLNKTRTASSTTTKTHPSFYHENSQNDIQASPQENPKSRIHHGRRILYALTDTLAAAAAAAARSISQQATNTTIRQSTLPQQREQAPR